MEESSQDYSPSSSMRWVRSGIGLDHIPDHRSSTNISNNYSKSMSWVRDDAGVGVPDERSSTSSVEGGEIMQDISAGTSPQVRQKIEKASPKTARDVALRMYESMKRHGLREEAGKALFEIEEMEEEDEDENGVTMKKKKSEELLGMDYLLKDGFVSYLRDMARITPPIPQQVNIFLKYIYILFIFFGLVNKFLRVIFISF